MYSIDMLKELDPEIGLACENELSRQAWYVRALTDQLWISFK